MSGRPRDSQRSKLYTAERQAFQGTRSGPADHLTTVPQIEAYVEKVIGRAWFRRRWPDFGGAPRIRPGYGARTARGGRSALTLPLWSRTEPVVLHELAHCIVARTVPSTEAAAHGWQFADVFLDLVRYAIGPDEHRALRLAFKANKVRYTKPRKGRTLTEAEKDVLRGRLAAARTRNVVD